MKTISLTAIAAMVSMSAFAADVGVSINIGQPGFYGQINLGSNLVPQLVFPQPVLIAPPTTTIVLPPLYLRVPVEYTRSWGNHCHEYNACGRKVYFVQDEWYEKVYAPRYREHPEEYREERHEHHHDKHDKGNHGRGRGHDDD